MYHLNLKLYSVVHPEDSEVKLTLIYNSESFLFTVEQVRFLNIFPSGITRLCLLCDNSLNYALIPCLIFRILTTGKNRTHILGSVHWTQFSDNYICF